MARRRIVRTKAELVRALPVSRSTVYRWLAAGAPQREDGSWDVDAVREWGAQRRSDVETAKADRQHGSAPPGKAAAGDDAAAVAGPGEHAPPELNALAQARLRDLQVRTAQRALELKERQGRFVEREEVARLLSSRMGALRRRHAQAARSIASRVSEATDADPLVVEEIAEAVLREILQEIYGSAPSDMVA